jgi:hypothetical protein
MPAFVSQVSSYPNQSTEAILKENNDSNFICSDHVTYRLPYDLFLTPSAQQIKGLHQHREPLSWSNNAFLGIQDDVRSAPWDGLDAGGKFATTDSPCQKMSDKAASWRARP